MRVESAVEAQSNRHRGGMCLFAESIDALNVQVNRLFTQRRDSRVDGFLDQVDVGGGGGGDDDEVKIPSAKELIRVAGGLAAVFLCCLLRALQEYIGDAMQHRIGVTDHAFGMDLSNASGTNEPHSKLIRHHHSLLFVRTKSNTMMAGFRLRCAEFFLWLMRRARRFPLICKKARGGGKDPDSIGLGCTRKSDVIRGRYPQTRYPVSRPHRSAWLCGVEHIADTKLLCEGSPPSACHRVWVSG